jgi:hypothetical protein
LTFSQAKRMEGSYDGVISIMKNDVWEIVPRTEGNFVVTSKWVYKIKHVVNGSIDKYKEIFVARGFSSRREKNMMRLVFSKNYVDPYPY